MVKLLSGLAQVGSLQTHISVLIAVPQLVVEQLAKSF